MDAKSSGFTCQNEVDSVNLKKIKSHKPIILLRRNSSGVIVSKGESANGGLSCLKSDLKILPSLNIKTECKGCTSFPETDQNEILNKKKNLKPMVKTENLKPISVQFKQKNNQKVAVKQPVVRFSQENTNCMNTFSSIDKTNYSVTCPTSVIPLKPPLLQPNRLETQQQLTVISQSQQGQALQVNNPHLNSLLSFSNEQFQQQPNLYNNRYFYPPVVQTRDTSMPFTLPENRQIFFQPNSADGNASEGM